MSVFDHLLHRLQARKLTIRKLDEVTSLSLYLSRRLLNDYIKAGIEVSNTVNEQLLTSPTWLLARALSLRAA